MDKFTQTPQGKSVEIKSMTVGIQVMAVNNKQMTLAVFKQLPEKKCFDEQGYSVGNWWGSVNYPFGDYKNGFWIVFELNGVLYKNWSHEIISYIEDMEYKKEKTEHSIGGSIETLLEHVYPEEIPPSTNEVVRIGTEKFQFEKDPSHILCEVTGINLDENIFIDFSIKSTSSALLIAEIPSIGWKKDILKFSGFAAQHKVMQCHLGDGYYIYLVNEKLFAGVHPDRKRYPIRDIEIEGLKDKIINLSIHLQTEERLHRLREQTSLLSQLFIAV